MTVTPKSPYGTGIPYADPGYQKDGKKRYPIDTKQHAIAAWSYIHHGNDAKKYTSDQLEKIEAKIKAALKKFGVEVSEDKDGKKSLVQSFAPAFRPRVDEHAFRATKLELRAGPGAKGDELPDGVCGRLTGVALTYSVPDDYGTVFKPGCLAKTRGEKVQAGKVKLFADHGPFTETHVGVVREVEDVGDTAVMTADLFDTDAGRSMKEYLAAVLASGAETGLSIGFRPRDKEWVPDGDGDMQCIFKEVELREISITPVPAVPGTDVTSVRHERHELDAADDGDEDPDLLRRALRGILAALPERDARAVIDEVAGTVWRESAEPSDRTAGTAGSSNGSPASSATGTNADRATESATGAVAEQTPEVSGARAAADAAIARPATIATPEQRIAAIRQAYVTPR